MAQKLTASMPESLDLAQGFQILFTAVDASTGAAVTAVNVSNASLVVAQLSAGAPGALGAGSFVPLWIPVEIDPTGDAVESVA
jgi:hypothetical protein